MIHLPALCLSDIHSFITYNGITTIQNQKLPSHFCVHCTPSAKKRKRKTDTAAAQQHKHNTNCELLTSSPPLPPTPSLTKHPPQVCRCKSCGMKITELKSQCLYYARCERCRLKRKLTPSYLRAQADPEKSKRRTLQDLKTLETALETARFMADWNGEQQNGIDPKAEVVHSEAGEQRTGEDAIHSLGLKRYRVKGDGSCWTYAVLASASLIEHAKPAAANDCGPLMPTSLDLAKDKHLRTLCVDWLLKNGRDKLNLKDDEMDSIPSFLKGPAYTKAGTFTSGTFGDNNCLFGVAAHVKRTIVLWSKPSLQNPMALQQVIYYHDNCVTEVLWSHEEICKYAKKNDTIHLEHNGADHFDPLLSSSPIELDSAFMNSLSTL